MTRLEITPLAKALLKYDPLLSHPATAWILHHVLVSREDSPTTWNWFFCKSGLVTFTRDQFLDGLRAYIAGGTGQKYADRSLEGDFQILVRMYQGAAADGTADSLFYPSVFGVLGLVEKNTYQDRYRRILNPDVPPAAFLYCLSDYAQKTFPDAAVLDVEHLREAPGSPFQSFGITLPAFFEMMRHAPEKVKKSVHISHTAGMHTISFGKTDAAAFLKLVFTDVAQESWI